MGQRPRRGEGGVSRSRVDPGGGSVQVDAKPGDADGCEQADDSGDIAHRKSVASIYDYLDNAGYCNNSSERCRSMAKGISIAQLCQVSSQLTFSLRVSWLNMSALRSLPSAVPRVEWMMKYSRPYWTMNFCGPAGITIWKLLKIPATTGVFMSGRR